MGLKRQTPLVDCTGQNVSSYWKSAVKLLTSMRQEVKCSHDELQLSGGSHSVQFVGLHVISEQRETSRDCLTSIKSCVTLLRT